MKTVYDRMMENDSYQKTKDFIIKQKWPYPKKKAYAEKIAWEFYQHPDVAGRCYVTVGGLDSITLFLFLRSIGINVPAVSVSSLEDKSIQLVHKALGIRSLPPIKDENGRPYTKMRVIQQYGYPVISKEAAQKISHLQNPTSKNATVRHAIMTGETGEYGGFKKNSRMKMSQKWLEKFGGPENENEGTNYQTAPFKVSDACCYYLKERPCDLYAKETKCFPYLGLMASEGGRRQKSLMWNGCNYVGKKTKRSCPFAIFSRQDLLTLALEMDAYYHAHWKEFKPITVWHPTARKAPATAITPKRALAVKSPSSARRFWWRAPRPLPAGEGPVKRLSGPISPCWSGAVLLKRPALCYPTASRQRW